MVIIKKDTRKKKNYINNKELYECIKSYQEKLAEYNSVPNRNSPPPEMPRYFGECVMLICSRLATRGNFSGYTYRDEMESAGIRDCVAGIRTYNTKFTNPHAYFTTIAWKAFQKVIKTEQAETYVKHKNFQVSGLFEAIGLDSGFDHGMTNRESNDLSNDVVKNFEDRLERNKIEAKKKAREKNRALAKEKKN